MDRPFPAYKGDNSYLFVSYSHEDSSAVFPELSWFRDQGFNTWYDEGIDAGTEWREEIARAIKNANLFLYFITPNSARSENCRKEVSYANDHGVPIIAIHLEPTELPDGLDLTLSDRQAVLKHEMTDQEYREKLPGRITSYLEQQTLSSTDTEAGGVGNKTSLVTPISMAVVIAVAVAIGVFLYIDHDTATHKDPDNSIAEEVDPEAVPVDFAALRSIAVLPFTNMSTSEEIGFFSKGLSEDILDELAQIKDLRVASRTASFRLDEGNQDFSKIAETLKVSYVLEGSVRQRGEVVRITAQLIRTHDGYHVWSRSYERELSSGFDVQASVAQNIAHLAQSELNFDIYSQHPKDIEQFRDVAPTALQYYFNASRQTILIDTGEGGDWSLRERMLLKAIEADDNFFMAYVLLANTYMLRLGGTMPLEEASPAAHAAANKMMAMKPDHYQSLLQPGQIYFILDLDYQSAEKAFRECIDRVPELFWCDYYLARIDLREGRVKEARVRMQTAAESEASVGAGSEKATFLLLHSFMRMILGDHEQALGLTEEGSSLALGGERGRQLMQMRALCLKLLGREDELADFFATHGTSFRVGASFLYLVEGKGNLDDVFEEIRIGIENHDQILFDSLRLLDYWNPIRDDPRFDELLTLMESKETHTLQYLRNQDSG